MAFKNLEARFNENVNKLYGGATLKFDNGIASSGKNDDPLIVRKPGDGQIGIKLEGRGLPVVSTIQDVKRLTLFNLSTRGLLFLAKQQLLQTGNTFEFTRALNPAFVVANAVPFLHVKRNLRPLKELVGKPDRSYGNVKTMGQLQFGTYNALKSKPLPQFVYDKPADVSRRGLLKSLGSSLLGPLKSLKDTVTGTLSAFNPLQKRNVGEIIDNWDKQSWQVSRPELASPSAYANQISAILKENQLKGATEGTAKVFSFVATTDQYADASSPAIVDGPPNKIKFIKYFNADDRAITSVTVDGADPVSARVTRTKPGTKLISYIKDPANQDNQDQSVENSLQEAYKPINRDFTDIINVSFAMGKDDAVPFRAFIKDLNQSATPEYKAYQYIGRIEKFINYVGVQREISFKLGIVAFGPSELETVWRRINYLTGLVFPYGFNKGIMQPNITRLTIGNVYVDQPGYVTSLSTNFTELSESWEIIAGVQVPIAAQMDIKFMLIEKASRIADSPFYGITDGGTSGIPMSRFSNTIPIPKSPLSTANAPQVKPLTTRVDSRTSVTSVNPLAVNKKPSVGMVNPNNVDINVANPNITIPPPNITFGK